jgi:protein-S-isoprenylcysteine O-methyltransferase Ste14
MCSDAQKNFTLRIKKGLISDGLFARTRNPNYLGECLVYCSLATCTGLWICWLYLGFVWATLFLERMLIKELSLMKKEGWET